MKKFVGLFALCALVECGYFGSLFGTALSICAFMAISGLIEEFVKNPKQKHKDDKEDKK